MEVQTVAGQAVEGAVEHADDFRRLVVDDALLLFIPEQGDGDAAAVMWVVAGIALVQELKVVERIAA
ncbi:hypothetical protein D3C78_1865880 [compost metagenome]